MPDDRDAADDNGRILCNLLCSVPELFPRARIREQQLCGVVSTQALQQNLQYGSYTLAETDRHKPHVLIDMEADQEPCDVHATYT